MTFVKGQSGNPAGRARGSRNQATGERLEMADIGARLARIERLLVALAERAGLKDGRGGVAPATTLQGRGALAVASASNQQGRAIASATNQQAEGGPGLASARNQQAGGVASATHQQGAGARGPASATDLQAGRLASAANQQAAAAGEVASATNLQGSVHGAERP